MISDVACPEPWLPLATEPNKRQHASHHRACAGTVRRPNVSIRHRSVVHILGAHIKQRRNPQQRKGPGRWTADRPVYPAPSSSLAVAVLKRFQLRQRTFPQVRFFPEKRAGPTSGSTRSQSTSSPRSVPPLTRSLLCWCGAALMCAVLAVVVRAEGVIAGHRTQAETRGRTLVLRANHLLRQWSYHDRCAGRRCGPVGSEMAAGIG